MADEDMTIVLLGCTGNGKSATGNSILGRKAFQSKSWFTGVTKKCSRKAVLLKDDRMLNVIDTPGLFDPSTKPELVQEEIVKCISMARDGIHAVLLVVSLTNRFTEEQVNVVKILKHLFGSRIVDYMIVAFTHGDSLEDNETLDDRLAMCPETLKDILNECGNRRILFDNTTKDKDKKAEQVDQLLTHITNIVAKNGGNPYTYELFQKLKAQGNSKQMYDEKQIQQRITEMVEEKLKGRDEEVTKLKEELDKVQKKLNAHKTKRQKADTKHGIEISRLKEQLARAEAQSRRNMPLYLIEARRRCSVM